MMSTCTCISTFTCVHVLIHNMYMYYIILIISTAVSTHRCVIQLLVPGKLHVLIHVYVSTCNM